MNTRITTFLLLSFSLIIGLTSCEKDTPDNPETFLDQRGFVNLKVHHKIDAQDFNFGDIHEDDAGNKYYFSRASVYMSQPELGGEALETYALITPDVSEYSIGRSNAGHKHMLSFIIGVDATANHDNPASYDSEHALALQSPSTHWNWNAGYLFIVLEGKYDSDADDIPDSGFQMHVGTDNLMRNKSVVVHADVEERGTTGVEMEINWAAFLDGIDLTTDNITHTANNLPLATSVADNAATAFSTSH